MHALHVAVRGAYDRNTTFAMIAGRDLSGRNDMQALEKILEEIEEAARQEDAPIYCGDMEVDGYVRMSVVCDIIRKHMNDG